MLLGLLIIPLTIKTTVVDIFGPYILRDVYHSSFIVDLYNYYKFIFLNIFTVILVAVFLMKFYHKDYQFKFNKTDINWALLFIFVLVSLMLAEYKAAALYGHMYEGTISYICYLLIFFVCMYVDYNQANLKRILDILTVIVVINALMSLLYYFGVDILQNKFVLKLMVPANIQINPGSYLISTLNNPNYVSGISAVLFMIFFSMSLLEQSKTRWYYLCITCISFALALSTLSTSGFLTILILIPVSLFIISKIVSLKKTVVPLLLIIIIGIGTYIPMAEYNPILKYETTGFLMRAVQKISWTTEEVYAQELSNDKGYQELESQDATGALNEAYDFPDPVLSAGSGRLYIWRKTIELIKERPLLGYGLGTMEFYFDNNDPNKVDGFFYGNYIITKPHSYFLGIAYGIGIPGLIAFLVLVFQQVFKTLKTIFKRDIELNIVHISIFIGILAFLFQALFNDSVVGMSIIFWLLFGISSGLLRQAYSSNKED